MGEEGGSRKTERKEVGAVKDEKCPNDSMPQKMEVHHYPKESLQLQVGSLQTSTLRTNFKH
jgi:hypothetical protein